MKPEERPIDENFQAVLVEYEDSPLTLTWL